ncbi:MAG: hypothetical protein JXB17_11085 [Bacteroidales bacterium]|nr:hypothetical protein [Bacteroidales bacterium]
MFKKLYIFIFILLLIINNSSAQRWKLTRYEVISSVGASFGQNDIVGVSEYNFQNLFGLKEAFAFRNFGLTGFLGARYRITEKTSIRISFDGGLFRGSDLGKGTSLRKFSTYFFEPTIHFEYFLIKEGVVGAKYSIMDYRGGISSKAKRNMMSLYLFTGIGTLHFWPFVNEAISSRPDYTDVYKHSIFVIPAGIGLKYLITNRNAMGLELGGRYTLIPALVKSGDFLDGIKPSISKSNDIYGFINLYWAYKLRASRNGLPSFKRK